MAEEKQNPVTMGQAMSAESRFMVPANVSWKQLDGSVVAVNLDTGVYFTFNPTASDAWCHLVEGKTLGDCTIPIHEAYPYMDTSVIKQDVIEIIASFVENNLMVLKTEPVTQ